MDIIRKHGHEAAHVKNIFRFATDEEIFAYAAKHSCIIVTRDLGFANMFIKNKGHGLILVRLPYYFKSDKINKVFDEFLAEINVVELAGSIIVLELGNYRIRKL
jgi:predicted nuclease of predicted toxin-antitoxin system